MEHTFTVTAVRRANLLPLIEDPVIREKIAELHGEIHDVLNEDHHGTRIHNVLSLETLQTAPDTGTCPAIELSDAVYLSLLDHLNSSVPVGRLYVHHQVRTKSPGEITLWQTAKRVNSAVHGGVRYQGYRRSPGASNILVQRISGNNETQPAQIEQVFSHARKSVEGKMLEEIFLEIRYVRPLPESEQRRDPYRHFNGVGGSLWMNQYQSTTCVIQPEQIICHIAKTVMNINGIQQPCFHILPLNRVSNNLGPCRSICKAD